MRRSAAIALTVLLTASTAACTGSRDPAQKAAETFLDALGTHDAAKAAAATDDAATAQPLIDKSLVGLGDSARAKIDIGKSTKQSATRATVAYTATWTLPQGATWTYPGTVPVAKAADGTWQVTWAPSDVQPQLVEGEHLDFERVQPERAALQDNAGSPLFTQQPVVTVGVKPADVKDLKSLSATLASALGLVATDISAQVSAAPKDQFVELITLRQAAYDLVKARIHDLPGTQFHESTRLLAPTPTFAQPLLGRVGQATKEIIDASKGSIMAGDDTGLSGLQRAYESQLAGTAGLSVFRVHASGDTTLLAELSPAKPGTPVRLTLDRRVQLAADSALAAVKLPATIVALQPSTGKVLAVAESDAAAAQGNIAFTGEYPPGSTFKIVTYTAAFTANPALTTSSGVDCPGTMTVNGQTIRNYDNFSLGHVDLTTAFDQSCNTSAASLGLGLPSGGLQSTAAALGLGANWKLPVDAFSGSLPAPTGASALNELAADAYGQGKVLVSPLLMASIAGAAATGTTYAPSVDAATPGAAGAKRSAGVTAALNVLMRAVVTSGTGQALSGLPGAVAGKTGTAEFGTKVPPPSHSWFAGTRGDLAFSVFIYGGEHSATGAVPLARTFLTALG